MLNHYVSFYPDTDILKTFRQTWKGKDDLYEEYYIDGKLSLEQIWDGDIWVKKEYNKKGKRIYCEDSTGYWYKNGYDNNGNRIYFVDSNGFWCKYTYDNNGNEISFEDSNGHYNNWSYKG